MTTHDQPLTIPDTPTIGRDAFRNRRILVFTGLGHHVQRLWRITDRLKSLGASLTFATTQNMNFGCDFKGDFEWPLIREQQPYTFMPTAFGADSAQSLSNDVRSFEDHFNETIRPRPAWSATLPASAVRTRAMFAMQHDRLVAQMIDRISPELIVVLHEFNAWTRPLCAAAQRRHVPVLSFLEGLLYESLPTGMLAAKVSSRVCLWGQAHHRRLQDEASDMQRLVITGPVHLDELRKDYLPRRHEFAQRFGLDDGRPLVLVIVPRLCYWPNAGAILNSLANYAKMHPQWRFAMKWHPHEKQNDIASLAIDSASLTMFQTEDTLQLITCADAIVSGGTTAGGEALAFDKPLIEINWQGRNVNLDYAKHGVCETITSENDWPIIAHILRSGPSESVRHATADYLADNFYRLDGHCLDRVLVVAQSLLERQA